MNPAVWSCDPDVSLQYPARYLFEFLDHHGMLTVFGSPTWRTVTGGSHRYVEAVAAGVDDIRLTTPVQSVRETEDGVVVTDAHGGVDGNAIEFGLQRGDHCVRQRIEAFTAI